ncbi:unnamed protein product [Mytilus coruscus]|uniref:Reverse transcriptase/retrotransposon-derived protein RNase H-like domain-containing protein n=1 Tax=Mytilus coruscus TaxID=42192 RepID=A0A6J8CCY6_MYTCO|nr:unnamed protein product [Mytilus coruscus]
MIRNRTDVGIKDSNLTSEPTPKKTTDIARQSETMKKQQAIMRSDNPKSNVNARLSKPSLGRPAIQALSIIDKVNVSSVDAISESNNYYRCKYPKIFNGLGKTKWTYTIALGHDTKSFALSTPRRVPLPLIGIAQETAFTEIKNEIASSRTFGHYDESTFGLGAVIRQKHGEILKPVVYDLRSMSYTEQRYSQIEKEELALTWACKHFSNYLRMPVDILSESNEFETETKACVDSIVNNFLASDMRLQHIRDECVKDEVCKTLMLYCKEGRQDKPSLNDSLKPYWSLQGELTIGGNI